MIESKLFCVLPDYVCTPDGMAVDQYGNLVYHVQTMRRMICRGAL